MVEDLDEFKSDRADPKIIKGILKTLEAVKREDGSILVDMYRTRSGCKSKGLKMPRGAKNSDVDLQTGRCTSISDAIERVEDYLIEEGVIIRHQVPR